MVQLVRVGQGMGARGAAGLPTIQPLVYEPESLTYFTALEGTGLTLTDARKYTINRAMKRLKTAGLHTKVGIAYAFSADAFAIDMLGNYARVKVGTPTFSNNAVSTAANTNYYEWDVMLSEVDPTDHCMGFLARTGSGSLTNSDQGALGEDSAHRLLINSKAASGFLAASSLCTTTNMGTTQQAGGIGFNAISRHPGTPGTFYSYTNGIMRASSATAAAASVSTNKLRDLMLGGGTSFSGRSFATSFYGAGLAHAEMCDLYAIVRSIDNAVVYGEPDIQDFGLGTAIVETDVLVVGLSKGAVDIAYEAAARQGLTAVLVGEERDTSPEHIGFNPVSWIDATDPTTVSGLCRTTITAANALIGKSDATTQTGLSVHQMRWNAIARQMLDATRTGGTLPGAAIPVYFSGGMDETTMATNAVGRECTEARAADGRIFRPKNYDRLIIVNGDYDGNLFPLMGIPYIKGTEARGSAPGENLNGYDPAALFPFRDRNGVEYPDIDPYIEEGNPASGLLPTVIDLPSTPDGDPDPTLQAMCYRLIATSLAPRMAPMTGGPTLAPSPDYDPITFEPLMRIFAAYTAGAYTAALADCYATGNSIESGVEDWNNGASGYSTDMGQLAAEWLFSETKSARMATIEKLTNFTRDYAYHILASGDSRIPASLITGLSARGLDTFWGVDPYPGHPLFFPPYPYKREARYQPKNTFNFSGNDTFMTDGTTPRSIKTVACGSYRADKHTTRWVNVGGELLRQGGLDDDSAGGVDTRCPVPLEAIVPDKADCTNLISPVVLFCTKVANSSLRMEPVFHLASQAAAIIARLALENGIAVQDVDYPTLRTALLAVPDAVTPVIPQTN